MELNFDISLRQFVAGRGSPCPLKDLWLKRGDTEGLELRFWSKGVAVELDEGAEIVFVIKNETASDAPALGLADTWVKESGSYKADLVLNGEALATLLGSAIGFSLFGELSVTDGEGKITSSRLISVVCENDLWKGTEETPLPLVDPEAWLDDRALRHDKAQALSSEAKQQARDNAGLGTAATKDTSTGGILVPDLAGMVPEYDSSGHLGARGLNIQEHANYRITTTFTSLGVENIGGTKTSYGFEGINASGGGVSMSIVFVNSSGVIYTPNRPGTLALKARESFTVATLPSASARPREDIWVSDYAGGARPAYSDGSTWQYYQPVIEIDPP